MPGIFHTITLEEVSHWPHANYSSTAVERTWLAPYAIVWSIVSTVLVLGRLVIRIQNRAGSFGADDVFIFVAWVFSIGFTTLACIAVWQYKIGRHIWDYPASSYEPGLFDGWLAQIMFIHTTCATKVSVLLFYHRMVRDTWNKKWLYTVWILLFITVASWIAIFVAYCFMCQPLNVFWTYYSKYLVSGSGDFTCIDGRDMTIAVGALTVASDFWTAALPCTLFQYHDLGVSRRQKIALNIIFCLGFLVTGVGIARTYYLWMIDHNDDLSWLGYNLFACCVVEIQLGLICTCAPFTRALFRKYGNRMSVSGPSGGTAERMSVRIGGMRTSFVDVTPLRTMERSPMRDVEEKSGCLVREEGTGRLVWYSKEDSSAASRPPMPSPGFATFMTEPLTPLRDRESGETLKSPASVMFPTRPLSPREDL